MKAKSQKALNSTAVMKCLNDGGEILRTSSVLPSGGFMYSLWNHKCEMVSRLGKNVFDALERRGRLRHKARLATGDLFGSVEIVLRVNALTADSIHPIRKKNSV